MARAPGHAVDPHTRWGVYATFGIYLIGVVTLVAGLSGAADTVVVGFFVWVLAQVALGLAILADAYVLGREGVDWSGRRYLYGVGSWLVPPIAVIYVLRRRQQVSRAIEREG